MAQVMDHHLIVTGMACLVLAGLVVLLPERTIPWPRVKYFLRRFRVDIITCIVAVICYAVAYLLQDSPALAFTLSTGITFAATLVIIYSRLSERDFYFEALQAPSDKDNWIGEGTFQYERVQGAFEITRSYSGFLFSKALNWSDYRFGFEFKILNASVGAIVRATDLSNLVMLQFFEDRIRAHIRVNGLWLYWDPPITGLTYREKLDMNRWHRCLLECDKGSIQIRIFQNDEAVLDRLWKIPLGPLTFLAESEDKKTNVRIPFPVNLEFGTVGFRNDGAEDAAVKNVLVEKLG